MSRWASGGLRAALAVGFAAALAGGAAQAGATDAPPSPMRYGLGQPALPAQIAGWDIDVRPDGTGLPAGRGSVGEGQAIYDAKCASCHGTFGESTDYLALAGGVGTLASDEPMRTTGSKLNYATTLFDYIRRAMPFNAPRTLTDHEVYALTAYVLHLNDLLRADAVLDRASLVALHLPNRDGFTTAHGLARVDGRPDTHNTACMTDCVASVRVVSELPAYARGSHGELASQMRAFGWTQGRVAAVAAPGDGGSEPAALAKQAACMTCHDVSRTVAGPAFAAVAQRYAGDDQALGRLAAKIRMGGSGAWGTVPMPAQAQVPPAHAEVLARWILGGAR
jgi:cytochrome c